MSLASNVHRCLAPRPLSSIWIGDDYLSTLLHQFSVSSASSHSHCSSLKHGSRTNCLPRRGQPAGRNRPRIGCEGQQVRYASSVPGPMESRKRAAKRRMMNLANMPAGTSFGADLMGTGGIGGLSWGEQDLRWKPPKQLERRGEEELRELPDWLEKYEERMEMENKVDAQSSIQHAVTQREPDPGVQLQGGVAGPSLHNELQRFDSIDQIRRAAFRYDTSIAHNKNMSGAAFLRLLDVSSPLSILMEYLEDPALNAPKAFNLRNMMNWPALQQQSEKDLGVLRSWIKERVTSGAMSEADIVLILQGVCRQYGTGNAVKTSQRFVSGIFNAVWTGIQTSSVNALLGLSDMALDMLLKVGSELPDLHESQLVIKAILTTRRYDWRKMRTRILSIAARASQPSQSAGLGSLTNDRQPPSFHWFIPILRVLPRADATQIITSISLYVVQRTTRKEQGSLDLTRVWFDALTPDIFRNARHEINNTKDWWFIERNLASLTPEILLPYLRLLDDREKYIFLVRYWFTSRWPKDDSTGVVTWQAFVRRFELELIPGLMQHEVFEDLVQRLHKHYPALLRNVLTDFYHLLRCLDQSATILSIAQYLRDRSFRFDSSVLATQVTVFAASDPAMACNLFKQDPRLRLEECPGFAEAYIANPPSAQGDVLHLFNLLNQGQPKQRAQDSNALPKLSPARVDLLHTMATAFASITHLSPERAFHRVERCLKYFYGRYDLLRPEMSKALVRAGIVRHLDNGIWVNDTRRNWILGFVRALEGEDIAMELDRMAWEWRRRDLEKTARERYRRRSTRAQRKCLEQRSSNMSLSTGSVRPSQRLQPQPKAMLGPRF